MNKKLMILLVAAVGAGSQIQTNGGGWGGFGGGLATGVILTSAVNSGNRNNNDPAYWDYKRDRYEDQRLAREVRNEDKQINQFNREIDRLMKRKDLSSSDRNVQIANKREQIKRHEEKRDDAQARRNS